LAKIAGALGLSVTDFNEARDLVEGRQTATVPLAAPAPTIIADVEPSKAEPPTPVATIQSAGPVIPCRRWLFASLDEFVANFMLTLKPDMSNGDHVVNTRDRISRAKDATQ